MSIAAGLKSTLGILDVAGSILDRSNPSHDKAVKQFDNIHGKAKVAAAYADRMNRSGSAITSLSSQTTILSRAFVDETIADEPIIANLFRTLHEWYAAQILAALHLSQMIDGHRTVQDVMSVVQTGHNARDRGLLGNIHARRMGMESFLSNYTGEPVTISDDDFGMEAFGGVTGPMGINDPVDAASNPNYKKPDYSTSNVKSVSVGDNRIGPMGELYEVKMVNPNDKDASVTVPIFIQMQPSLMSADIAPRFIDMNVAPAVWQRWTMWRAGEKTFWLDFLLNRDMIKRQKSMLKDPAQAEAFSTFLKTVSSKDKYAIDDATDRLGSRQSSNLANSVVVFSEDTVLQAKADSGVDLHNPRDRQRYFRDTYTMIIVIVDPLHQRVTIYFNGLDGDINTSYNDFRPKDSKFEPKEFMTALQAFSSNNISRLR